MFRNLLFVSALALTAGCSTVPDQDATADSYAQEDHSDPRDPFEPVNRSIYDFNMDVLDKYLLRPASIVYRDYVPSPVRSGMMNIIDNLDEPSSAVNNLLQLNFKDSARNAGRFLVNTTFGIVGIFDVAEMWGVPAKYDEFGEVLGNWGVSDGPYLMLPAAGPTTVRNSAGDYVDGAYWPLAGLSFWHTLIKWGVSGLDARVALLDQEDMLNESLDPYGFVKEAYFQNQQFKLYDGQIPESGSMDEDEELLDEFMDEIDE